MDHRHFCVFDFETGSTDTATTEILQIGSVIIDCRSFKIKDEFKTLMKPKDFDAVEDGALKVNGLTREELADAPEASVMFPTWAAWIQRHNINKTKSSFGAPIPVYWGGDRFDLPIMDRYCKEYGYWDHKYDNGTLVNPIFTFDVMKHMWFWTRTLAEPKNVKLVTVAEWMGIPKAEIEKGAHDGFWDAKTTARIAVKLLKLGSYMTELNDESKKRRLEMKGCFAS